MRLALGIIDDPGGSIEMIEEKMTDLARTARQWVDQELVTLGGCNKHEWAVENWGCSVCRGQVVLLLEVFIDRMFRESAARYTGQVK